MTNIRVVTIFVIWLHMTLFRCSKAVIIMENQDGSKNKFISKCFCYQFPPFEQITKHHKRIWKIHLNCRAKLNPICLIFQRWNFTASLVRCICLLSSIENVMVIYAIVCIFSTLFYNSFFLFIPISITLRNFVISLFHILFLYTFSRNSFRDNVNVWFMRVNIWCLLLLLTNYILVVCCFRSNR